MDEHEWYWFGYKICFGIVFIGCWIYCIAAYGFLLGVGLGWLPSLIAAGVIALAWPLVFLLLLIIAVIILWVLLSHE